MSEQEAEDEKPRRGRRRKPGGRVRMAHFVTRDGEVLIAMQRADDDAPHLQWTDLLGQYGRGDDVCRRALGLPTAGPSRDVRELWALVWCDVIVEQVLNGPPPAWPQIAAAHPAIGRMGFVDGDATAWAVDNLVRLGNEYAEQYPWETLRALCARNEWPMTGIDAGDAAWMDAGMFSRWALEPYPELFDVLEDLSVLLPPDSAYRVWRTVDAWTLP
jgi:hypothetical protein